MMSEGRLASDWLRQFRSPAILDNEFLHMIYGVEPKVIQDRIRQILHALDTYLNTFGDHPVHIVRAPGRVNLRGMHVDTHGGYLNLMTHQREIVVVCSPTDNAEFYIHNTDPAFAMVEFCLDDYVKHSYEHSWGDLIASANIANQIHQSKGSWENYLIGASYRTWHQFGSANAAPHGMRAIVAGDIPRGAALSSSHALCVAMLLANATCTQKAFSNDELILAARDVEWFAGARTGTSDQAAIVLGQPGKLVHAALLAEDFSTQEVTWHDFPEALDLLVVHSHTTRNLSGADKRAYTQNRFAYTIALDILRQTLAENGTTKFDLKKMDRLSNIRPENFGGLSALYEILLSIPEAITLREVQKKYNLPHFEESFSRYFSGFPKNELPESINLRGPLLFGIAESERARIFARLLDEGFYAEAGKLMCIGHNGDRIVNAQGKPFQVDLSDATLKRWAVEVKPITECPGAYGASSPVLDFLVDTALKAGALGACLTGAGIAGSILVLCENEKTEGIMQYLHSVLATFEYAQLALLQEPLRGKALDDAVMINHAVAGAGIVPEAI